MDMTNRHAEPRTRLNQHKALFVAMNLMDRCAWVFTANLLRAAAEKIRVNRWQNNLNNTFHYKNLFNHYYQFYLELKDKILTNGIEINILQ